MRTFVNDSWYGVWLTLTLLGWSSVHADLVLNTGGSKSFAAGQISDSYVVQATVASSSSTVAGWQTSLQIVPDLGSTGTVTFQSVVAASTDYVLGSLGNGIAVTFNAAMDRVQALDYDAPAGGVTGITHSVASVVSLNSLTFAASPSAVGTFGLYAIDEPSWRTQWTDWSGTLATSQQFTNLAKGTTTAPGSLRLATLTVSAIPEPGGVLLSVVTLAAIAGVRLSARIFAKLVHRSIA